MTNASKKVKRTAPGSPRRKHLTVKGREILRLTQAAKDIANSGPMGAEGTAIVVLVDAVERLVLSDTPCWELHDAG